MHDEGGSGTGTARGRPQEEVANPVTAQWERTNPELLARTATDPSTRLELALLAAWCPQTLLARPDGGGCVVRYHSGMTKRANSALALAPSIGSVGEAARWYGRHGHEPVAMVPCGAALPPCVRPSIDPEALVMTAQTREAIGARRPTRAPTACVSTEPHGSFIERTARRARPGTPPTQARALAARLLTSAPEQVFASTPSGATGRLALTGIDGTAVIDGIFVPRWARRRGEATAVVKALIETAAARNAHRVALEVEDGNDGAIACYLRLGFEVRHRHRYVTCVTADPAD